MILCLHEWIVVERITHAEIDEADPVRHTALVAIGCRRCRTVLLYPIENAALVTRRYFATLRHALAAREWYLPADLEHRVPLRAPE